MYETYVSYVSNRLSILFFLCISALSTFPSAQIHPITIHANQRVASLQMSPSEYRGWIVDDGFNVDGKVEALVQDIYRKFNDEFDFIFLVLNEEKSPESIDYAGQLISVSSKDKGLGGRPFDFSKDYGSAGGFRNRLFAGPALQLDRQADRPPGQGTPALRVLKPIYPCTSLAVVIFPG